MTTKNKARCVYKIKRNGKVYRYMSRVIIDNIKYYIGCFETEEQASNAYVKFMNKYEQKQKEFLAIEGV